MSELSPDGTSQGRVSWFSDELVGAYTRAVIRARWFVVAAFVALALAAGYGGSKLDFAADYRVFFSDANPQLIAFERMQDVYSKDDNIQFVIKPKDGIFTAEALSTLREFTEESWQVPYATRVDSLTNFQHSTAIEDDLLVQDLVPGDSALDEVDLARIREVALSEPLLVNRLIAPDGLTAGINVTLTMPLIDNREVPEAMDFARGLADGFQARHSDWEIRITGAVPLNNAFIESSEGDLAKLVPLMYVALLIVTGLLLRSIGATFATLVIILLSAVTAMGLAGWLGIKLSPPSSIAPTIILTIAVADSIHILVSFFSELRKGTAKQDALVKAMQINFDPVFLTSLTTIIGFLTLNFSDAPPFADLGNITSMGVAAAWLYSITVLPALVAILPIKTGSTKIDRTTKIMEGLANVVVGNRWAVLGVTGTAIVVLIAMIPRLELNDQFVNYFDESLSFRADTDFAMENLTGIYQAQWSLTSGESQGIADPTYLAKVEEFARWLEGQKGIRHVNTMSDIFKRLNKNMHGDDPAYYDLPGERELAAQYLLLFEMSLPYGLDLNNQIDVDKSSIRITATLEDITTRELRKLDSDATAWLAENLPSAGDQSSTSAFVMFAYISERNIEGMLVGTGIAFTLISISLILALRNLKLGLISLVPNLVPPAMAFGIWALLVGEIGLAGSVVTATSLGIIVDATVHFLSKYRRARVGHGADAAQAVRYAFSTVGKALWVTTAILVAGFAVLSLSTFAVNAVLGQLTAIALVCAIVTDFLLLPALLLWLDGKPQPARELQPAE